MALPSGRTPPAPSAGVRIGKVTGFEGGPLVEVAGMVRGHSYGPARVTETLSARLTTSTAAETSGSHAHSLGQPLAVGDTVLVAFLGDSRTELVVIDRLLPIA